MNVKRTTVPEKHSEKLKLQWPHHPLQQSGSNTVLPGVLTLTQQALVVATWPGRGPAGPVFWLVEDEWQLKLAQEALKLWAEVAEGSWLASGGNVAVWPAVQPPRPVVLHRLVSHEPTVVLTTIAALTGKAMHPEAFRTNLTTVHIGARMRPADLVDRLVPQGFSRAAQADQPGLVAVRGGTVDVWLEREACTCRIEFGAKTVEGVSLVRANGKQEPATDVAITPPHMPAYARAATGLSYLDEKTTLLTTPALHAELGFRVNPGVRHVTWTAGADGFGQPVRLYHRRWNELKLDCESIVPDGWQVLALSSQAAELRRQLAGHGVAGVRVAELPESVRGLTGFRDERNRIMVLTDFELLGSRHDVQERRRKLAKATAQALKEGDYVVHVDHGVARFAGLCEKEVDGATRHYLQLDYAGGGKLYLPVEQADRITRYLGQAHPPLSKLDGGGAWAAALKKVKVEAGELARQILMAAARRQVHGGFGLADHADEAKLAASFPYQPTPDQQQAVDEILADMRRDEPMDRLLAGDVGFGKTEVAIRAAFKAVRGGKQVAVLCPTTVLATQHLDTFNKRLQPFGVRCVALTRFQSNAEQKRAVEAIKRGEADVAIGTHRLLSKDVQFSRLGLAIIDEEQKFGVKNKEQLKNLRTGCHVLALSATPIPRTLNMALSGLKDISTIETPPPGRLPIETNVLPYSDEVVREALEQELARGGQAYFVSNKVARIEMITDQLRKLVPKARFDIGHGQMAEDKLAEVMHRFDEGEVDVLVCSTIVENGLDLPNVNTVIIENAPALGLAQAYQLRGRVGRGGKQAYAYFLYPSQKLVGQANERLKALLQHNALGSGFQIAMRDMELRGVGNALGKQQHGPAVSVGLHLYSRLLEETLLGMRDNRPPPDEQDVAVDLPLSAYIPAEVEPDQASRLRLYQQLANEDEAGLQRYADDVHARFVGMPLDPLDNLLEVLRLKILCRAAGVAGVDSTVSRSFDGLEQRWVRIKLGHDAAVNSALQWATAHAGWEFKPKDAVLRVRQDSLGGKVLPKIEEALRFLAG